MTVDTDVGFSLALSESELKATRAHIVEFIRDQRDAARAEGAVLGLSGGIDSTLTAYLATEALGADVVHGLVMPGTPSSDANMSDAERVAVDLDIEYDVVPIEPIAETVYDAYPAGAEDHVATGNVRARLRAVLNYFVANHEHAIVLGTGNRTEALVGYFTKYGDGAVDCHPIGTLYKQQVRQLAAHLGVPDDIVSKTPSAELWADQTDEGELGLDYDTIDAILALTVDGPLSPAAAAGQLDGVTVEQIEHVHDLHATSAHKRAVPPTPAPLR